MKKIERDKRNEIDDLMRKGKKYAALKAVKPTTGASTPFIKECPDCHADVVYQVHHSAQCKYL